MVTLINNKETKIMTSYEDDKTPKNEIETRVFKYINENKYNDLIDLFFQHKLKPDIYDNDGMTPLQHACYKGNKIIVEFLLEQGADVNKTLHEHKYTALHFAALSGNSEICLLLMMAGVDCHQRNTVGRKASQMAAFVGNHSCVAVINNYVPRSDLEYYSIPRGVETKPKLSPALCVPLYAYIMQVNIHPVRLAVKMPKVFLKEHLQIKKVLELMSEREIKKGSEKNEVLSFKFHYLAFILNEIHKSKTSEKQMDPVEIFVKKILKGSRGEEYLDLLLRECVREFPYRDSTLFQQMVKSLARKEDSPPALNVVISAINGQCGLNADDSQCVTCAEPKAYKKCSKCRAVQYCDRECQRLHWFVHKKECNRSSTTTNTTGKERNQGEEKMNEQQNVLDKVENIKINN